MLRYSRKLIFTYLPIIRFYSLLLLSNLIFICIGLKHADDNFETTKQILI